MSLRARYEAALDFDAFVEAAAANQGLWASMYRLARVPDDLAARAQALPQRVHLLVLNEDWCGDAVNTVPAIAKLATVAGDRIDMRLLGRDANPDLMDGHLTGNSRSIPVVIVLDEAFVERGWWGPRPRELQSWVLGPGQSLAKAERYREIRRWYARDRALTTLDEVLSLVERVAAPSAQ